MLQVAVHDRGDVFPEALPDVDTDVLQMRMHERDCLFQMAKERALARLHVFDRAAPLAHRVVGIATLAPDADDESGATVLEQCHRSAPDEVRSR
ncbi:hypothetical protein [Xanthomonas hortorum]|uniref:hypothetical protein n=1 Tax=Xanthomonas hortorum TaxID=56454 RepID=UPI001E556FC1|nr:hypothetical protein [Xanthomonas hortorum]MCC8552552.1 hypothetical protein [Xanthomonas hortorum pv. gardneri]